MTDQTNKLQVGQYWRTRGGEIRKVIADTREHGVECTNPIHSINKSGQPYSHTSTGSYYAIAAESTYDLVEHLPDCDGFDWIPKPADPYPRYCDAIGLAAYIRIDGPLTVKVVEFNGVEKTSCFGESHFRNRNRLTESEALSRVKRKHAITFRHFVVWDNGGPKYSVRIENGYYPEDYDHFRDTGKMETHEVAE